MSPTLPTSPSRLSFRSHGMSSTVSLTSPSIRSRRPSFGSVRLFGTRRGSNTFDANGDPLSHRNSMVGDAPPTLDVPVLDSNIGRDEAFVKSALEGIAEVRVSQEIQRSHPPKLDMSFPTALHSVQVSSPLSRKEASATPPTTLDDINAPSSTSPTNPTDAPPSSSHNHQELASALVPEPPQQTLASTNPEINVTSPENGQGDKTPTVKHPVPA